MNLFCFLQKNIWTQSRFVFNEVPREPEHQPHQTPQLHETQQPNTVEGLLGKAQWKAYKATAENCAHYRLISQAVVDRWKANPSSFSKENLVNAINWDTFTKKYVGVGGLVDSFHVDEDLGPFFFGLMREVKIVDQSANVPRFETISGRIFDLSNQEFRGAVMESQLENDMSFFEAAEYILEKGYAKR